MLLYFLILFDIILDFANPKKKREKQRQAISRFF